MSPPTPFEEWGPDLGRLDQEPEPAPMLLGKNRLGKQASILVTPGARYARVRVCPDPRFEATSFLDGLKGQALKASLGIAVASRLGMAVVSIAMSVFEADAGCILKPSGEAIPS